MPGQALIYNEAKLTLLSNSAEAYPSDKKKASSAQLPYLPRAIPPAPIPLSLSLSLSLPSLSHSLTPSRKAR